MEDIQLQWAQNVVDKIIEKHGITPEEINEVIYDGKPFLQRGPGSGRNRRYYVLGQTLGGRYIFIVLKKVRGTVFSTVTARDMKGDERRLYKRFLS